MDNLKDKKIKIFDNVEKVFEAAAKDFFEKAKTVIKEKGIFTVVLSGGNTPKNFFDTLVKHARDHTGFPWDKILFFFGDERYVSPEDEKSNYHTAKVRLFSKVPVNYENIYRIPTEFNSPKDSAMEYEKTIRKILKLQGNSYPEFNLCYLGLGDDAHTASLMPSSDVVINYVENSKSKQNHKLVASLFAENVNMYRITLLPTAINHSDEIVFLVTGASKSDAVWEVLQGPENFIKFPAQLIETTDTKTTWYLDKEAAAKIKD